MTKDLKDTTRRHFLQASLSLPTARFACGSTGLLMGMAAMDNAQAAAAPTDDYKAIVCCYLAGGSDYANTVVTYDADSYSKYAAIRGDIALQRETLTQTLLRPNIALPNGRQYALHPAMKGVADLFNAGKAAVLLNVGPLIQPLTRAQFNAGAPRPRNLFSHNDQSSTWLTGKPEGYGIGWGGTLLDLVAGKNGDASKLSSISISGTAVFLSGKNSFPLRLNTEGLSPINAVKATNTYGSTELASILKNMISDTSRPHLLETEYNVVTKRSMDLQVTVQEALSLQPLTSPAYNVFSNDALSSQLRLVARMAAASKALGVKRQIFFVRHGPFDLHDKLIIGQQNLLKQLNNAVTAFQASLTSLNMAEEVTLFTASDFGRSLTSNGDGSDHGWGSHHFIVGGSVNGNKFYGKAPPVSVTDSTDSEDQWHVGNGRLLPSTSVDQLGATLASWFGVADADLRQIMPNIKNFDTTDYPKNLGFMSS